MVFVGNHHPSSSHIINQKTQKRLNNISKNTHVKKAQSAVLNFFSFYNVQYAQKHKFWSSIITKNNHSDRKKKERNITKHWRKHIRLKNKTKKFTKTKKKTFFLYNTLEKVANKMMTISLLSQKNKRRKKNLNRSFNQKKKEIITDLWKNFVLLSIKQAKKKLNNNSSSSVFVEKKIPRWNVRKEENEI